MPLSSSGGSFLTDGSRTGFPFVCCDTSERRSCWVSSEHSSSSHSVGLTTCHRIMWKKSFLCLRLKFPDVKELSGILCHALSSLFLEPLCSQGCITHDVGIAASTDQTQPLLFPGSRWRQPMAELPLKLTNPDCVFYCFSGRWFVKSTVDTTRVKLNTITD